MRLELATSRAFFACARETHERGSSDSLGTRRCLSFTFYTFPFHTCAPARPTVGRSRREVDDGAENPSERKGCARSDDRRVCSDGCDPAGRGSGGAGAELSGTGRLLLLRPV